MGIHQWVRQHFDVVRTGTATLVGVSRALGVNSSNITVNQQDKELVSIFRTSCTELVFMLSCYLLFHSNLREFV